MLDTSARLLRLLSALQARRYWSGPELAAHLEVTERTLRRDIDRLRSLGYVVEATSGPGGGYQLGKGAAVPPLLLDDDEAVAVAVSLRSAADAFVGLGETVMGVLVKLDQMLPGRLRRRVGALQSVTVSVTDGRPLLDPHVLTTLAAACRDNEQLAFAYHDHEGKPSTRRVEPLGLAHTGNRRWYLVAWDIERADWRTFRVDRIDARVSVGPRFAPRQPPADLATYVARSISDEPYRHRARVALRGSAEAMSKQVPPWCGVIEPLDAERCVLSTGAGSLEALVAQLVLSNVDFELLEPPELAPALRKIAKRLERAARGREPGRARPRPGTR
jgi:predicted DNA-binding transcriptional regulator YafY